MKNLICDCLECGGEIEFTSDICGEDILCPHCQKQMKLPGGAIHRLKTENTSPKKTCEIEKTSRGGGCLIQGLGLLLCLTILGAIIGIPLLIWGGQMARSLRCGNCGNKIEDDGVRMCPTCHSFFAQ